MLRNPSLVLEDRPAKRHDKVGKPATFIVVLDTDIPRVIALVASAILFEPPPALVSLRLCGFSRFEILTLSLVVWAFVKGMLCKTDLSICRHGEIVADHTNVAPVFHRIKIGCQSTRLHLNSGPK